MNWLTAAGPPGRRLQDDATPGFAALYVVAFLAYGDRFLIGPLLVVIAEDFRVSLGAATAVATVYLLLYGALQLVYGFASDRLGRVRVMRGALLGVVAANLFCAVAPSLGALVAGRAAAATFAAALLPTSLVYVSDRVPFDRRQQVVANVLAAGSLGTVAATVGAGLLGRSTSWRFVFLVPALLAAFEVAVLGRLPESVPGHATGGPVTQLRRVFAHPWAAVLVVLAVAEGATMLGFLTFLAPALQTSGVSSAVAGLVVAVYGLAVFATLQVVKRLLRRLSMSPVTMIATGGAILVGAYLVAASAQTVPNILVTSLLIGVGYSFMHSTLQTWATEVAPDARGTATSLFVTAVFTGASIAHTVVSPLASDHRFGRLFLVGAVAAAPVTVVAAVARGRFGSEAPPPAPPVATAVVPDG